MAAAPPVRLTLPDREGSVCFVVVGDTGISHHLSPSRLSMRETRIPAESRALPAFFSASFSAAKETGRWGFGVKPPSPLLTSVISMSFSFGA